MVVNVYSIADFLFFFDNLGEMVNVIYFRNTLWTTSNTLQGPETAAFAPSSPVNGLRRIKNDGIFWWARPNPWFCGKCSSNSTHSTQANVCRLLANYFITRNALFWCACAVYVFPSMCRQITCRETVDDHHVSAVANLRSRFTYLPPVVPALSFDSCLYSSLIPLPKNERKR